MASTPPDEPTAPPEPFAADAPLAATPPAAGEAAPLPNLPRSELIDELRNAEQNLIERRAQEKVLADELDATEARLAASQRRTVEALDEATQQLEEVEARAAEAEARASRAERMAKLKTEEIEREGRLREMLDRIADAERRASAAEDRARETVGKVGEPAEVEAKDVFGTGEVTAMGPGPEPEVTIERLTAPEPEPQPQPEPFVPPTPASAPPPEPPPEPEPFVTPTPEPEPQEPAFTPTFEQAPEPEPVAPQESPEASEVVGGTEEGTINPPAEPINVNEVGYEELRDLGLSVTQTGRVLAFRERSGGFTTLDDLNEIPGFPSAQLEQLKRHLKL